MLTDVLGKKKTYRRNGKRIKWGWKARGKWEEEIRVGQKRRKRGGNGRVKKIKMMKKGSYPQNRTWSTDTNGYRPICLE